ncbi:uncharacterized protein LOC144647292 isoform X2 [Oculina patagonica]
MACHELFGVVNDGRFAGNFYKRTPPQCGSPNWLGTAKPIGIGGWNDFNHLFFHPDGTLYGVWDDKFYKGPPPEGSSAFDWKTKASLIGNVGWKDFKFLFFDPDGVLYGVHNTTDKFYKRCPPAGTPGSDPDWIGNATLLGSGGWCNYKFLFFDTSGILYGVENESGKFHRRIPPTDPTDNWLGSSTLIGTGGWNDFQLLYFMPATDRPDGELYGVYKDKFYKGPPPTHGSGSSDNWLGSAETETIGSVGWSKFKFLMSPLK